MLIDQDGFELVLPDGFVTGEDCDTECCGDTGGCTNWRLLRECRGVGCFGELRDIWLCDTVHCIGRSPADPLRPGDVISIDDVCWFVTETQGIPPLGAVVLVIKGGEVTCTNGCNDPRCGTGPLYAEGTPCDPGPPTPPRAWMCAPVGCTYCPVTFPLQDGTLRTVCYKFQGPGTPIIPPPDAIVINGPGCGFATCCECSSGVQGRCRHGPAGPNGPFPCPVYVEPGECCCGVQEYTQFGEAIYRGRPRLVDFSGQQQNFVFGTLFGDISNRLGARVACDDPDPRRGCACYEIISRNNQGGQETTYPISILDSVGPSAFCDLCSFAGFEPFLNDINFVHVGYGPLCGQSDTDDGFTRRRISCTSQTLYLCDEFRHEVSCFYLATNSSDGDELSRVVTSFSTRVRLEGREDDVCAGTCVGASAVQMPGRMGSMGGSVGIARFLAGFR